MTEIRYPRRDREYVVQYGATRITDWLTPLVNSDRLALIHRVVAARRTDVTLLCDRFYDPHNNAAVLRTCEAFGLRELHAVPGKQGANLATGIVQGTDKWIDFVVHENIDTACDRLQDAGYALVGADVNGVPPEAIGSDDPSGVHGKICVVMGTEKQGLLPDVRARCTQMVTIPMVGMVESFNVSVAAALILQRLLASRDPHRLNDEQTRELIARYLIQTIQRPDVVLANLAERNDVL